MVAYIESGKLWIRDLRLLSARGISGTDGARLPLWSPLSDYVAYIDSRQQKLKKVDIIAGTISIVCDYGSIHQYEGVWGPTGNIVYPNITKGNLTEVAAQGGEPTPMIRPNPEKGEEGFNEPLYLPDGRTLLGMLGYSDNTGTMVRIEGTDVIPIPGLPANDIDHIAYSNTGHILYSNVKGLWAVPFSASEMKFTGQPIPIDPHGLDPSVSDDGTLVYVTSRSAYDQLVWLNRDGTLARVVGQPQEAMLSPAISPDGKKVAVGGFENGNWDIWIHDVDLGTKVRRTFNPEHDIRATWSSGGDTLIFESSRNSDGALFKKASDGSGKVVQIDTGPMYSYDPTCSRDGQYLTYVTWKGSENSIGEIWYIAMNSQWKPMLFLEGNPYADFPTISPDNRYLAYSSIESGIKQIYVDRFPIKKGINPVSLSGGVHPSWNSSGQELFYVDGNALLAVKVDTRSDFKRLSKPDTLFAGAELISSVFFSLYDVAPDGQHFVVVRSLEEPKINIVVVQNWIKEFEGTE